MKNLESRQQPPRIVYAVLAVVAALCLMIANSAFWFQRYIFDVTNFTPVAMSSLNSQSSRTAIASEITDQALKNRPALKGVIDEQATSLISGLLDSPRVEKLMTRTIIRLQTMITSKNPQSITIDLTSIKNTISVLASLRDRISQNENQEPAVDVNSIPDTIVLVDANKLPNIYNMGITLSWLGPLTLIIAIAALGFPLFQTYTNIALLARTLLVDGIAITLGALFSFLIGPIFKPHLLSQVNSPNIRMVVNNLYDSFIHTFNQQTIYFLLLGIAFLIASAVTWYVAEYRD